MPFEPTIYNRHGARQEDRSVQGWAVVDLTTYRPVIELGGYGPHEQRLAVNAALLLDTLIHGPAPEVRLEPGPRADLLNYSLVVAWTRKRSATPGLQVGDVVRLADGSTRRVAHIWPDGWQPTWPEEAGSFAFGDGFTAHSGSLDPLRAFPEPTEETQQAAFWIAHHDRLEAGCAVHVSLPVRVWQMPEEHTPSRAPRGRRRIDR